MTFQQLLQLTNKYRLTLLSLQNDFMVARQFGVQYNGIRNRELLDLLLLQKLLDNNETTPLLNEIILPAWFLPDVFDVFISVILKRTSL